MSIIVKQTGGGDFTPCPAGLHHGICVDVVDLGVLKVAYSGHEKQQHKIRIVWQVEDMMPSGKPYIVQKRYTASLHEKASLRKDLESWRSRPFTPAELEGFDLENLIGVNCQLSVMHDSRDGSTYANITSVVPPPRGGIRLEPRDYVRVKDRTPEQTAQAGKAGGDGEYQPCDDDIPF